MVSGFKTSRVIGAGGGALEPYAIKTCIFECMRMNMLQKPQTPNRLKDDLLVRACGTRATRGFRARIYRAS